MNDFRFSKHPPNSLCGLRVWYLFSSSCRSHFNCASLSKFKSLVRNWVLCQFIRGIALATAAASAEDVTMRSNERRKKGTSITTPTTEERNNKQQKKLASNPFHGKL